MNREFLQTNFILTEKHIYVIAAVLLLVFIFARLDNWLFTNEVFAWMQAGVQPSDGESSLLTYREAAVENCNLERQKPLSVCYAYQSTFLGHGFLLHPIHQFFGTGLLSGYGERPWLDDLQSAAIGSVVVGGALAVALWLLLVRSLPRELRMAAAVLSLLLLVLGYYRDEPSLVLPDPFAGGVRSWEVAVLLVVAAATLFGQRMAGHLLPGGISGLAEWIDANRRRLLQVLLAGAILNLILPPIGAAAVQVLALLAIIVSAWWLAASRDISPLIVGSVVVLLVITVSGDSHFLLRKLETSKNQLNLVLGVYLAYLTVRPRGTLVCLLPALAVFHVPETALFGLALFLAELPLCLRRLRISLVLVVSGASFALWTWIMQMSDIGLGEPSRQAVWHVLSLAMASPRLWPTALVMALVAVVSLWPLLRRNDTWDPLARCGLLILQCIGAVFIGLAVLESEPGLEMSPGYFQIIKVSNLLGPPLAFGIVLSLALLLFRMTTEGEPSASETPSSGRADLRRIAPIALLVLLLGLAKIDLTPRFLVLDALKNTVVYVALGRHHPDWCRYLAQGAGFDDRYILSGTNPTNGVENAFSALKLKLRISLGLHKPDKMEISIAKAQKNGCEGGGD